MGRCTKCGRELPPQGKFCPGCGATLEAAPSAGTATAAPPGTASAGVEKQYFGFSRWDAAAIIGAILSAAGWHFWTTLDKYATRDGFTQMYILGFTAAVIFLRRQIDSLLMPLHALKKHIPRLVLIGIALALPYFLAHYFYNDGLRNYPLMHKSIAWGTIFPYVLLRIPGSAAGVMRRPLAATHGWMFFGLIAAAWLGEASLAFADDFARDFTRIEDGLRTDGWAETIAGTTATAINVLVNGSLVFQQPGKPSPDGEESVQYTMDVRTEDQRTSIAADGQDRLWCYAKILCSKASVDAQGLTSAISFTFEGSKYAEWMSITSTKSQDGFKAVLLACTAPSPQAELKEDAFVTVLVSGMTADGKTMQGPVKVNVMGGLHLDFF